MNNSNVGHIPMQERIDLNKSQGAQTLMRLLRFEMIEMTLSLRAGYVFVLNGRRRDLEKLQQQVPLQCLLSESEYIKGWSEDAWKLLQFIMLMNRGFREAPDTIKDDIHYVRESAGQVRVLHVPSRYQFADIFTKGLPSALFEEFRTSLSVRCPPAPTAGEC
ncbi:hypothetical protein Tco_0522511 [Tanacetum coccineum]